MYTNFLIKGFVSPSTEIFLTFHKSRMKTFLRLSKQTFFSSNVLRMHLNGKRKSSMYT